MNREDIHVKEEDSNPNTVRLSDGSYLSWDHKEGFFRVAYYQRSAKKGSDLEMTISLAMKKPLHNFRVKQVFDYISKSDEYAAVGS